MPDRHALLSPSKAKQWMECPPSARLTEGIPEKPSPFAEEGTKAHAFAAAALNEITAHAMVGLPDMDFKNDTDRRIYEEVKPYIEHQLLAYMEAKVKHADAVLFVEKELNLSTWIPEGFGTADSIMVAGDTMTVTDLKFGKGVPISAVDNPQTRCYALGAYRALSVLYDIDNIIIRIDQPRLDSLTEETLSSKELNDWGLNVLMPAARKAWRGDGEEKVGPWCQFCKLLPKCAAHGHNTNEVMAIQKTAGDTGVTLSPEAIHTILTKGDDVIRFIKAVQQQALNELLAGHPVPGFKVVEGRSVRQYSDEILVAEKLKAAGYDEAVIYNRSLINITDMEKLVGKKKFNELLGSLIEKPKGRPTMAKDSDRRPEFKPNAADDFIDIDVENVKEEK